MNLDPRTMMFINFVSSYIISVGLLNFSQGYLSQVKHIKNWAYATILQSFAWILIGLRGTVPDFFSIVMANIFLLTSVAVYFNILCQFLNIKIKPYLILIPVLISAVFIIYYTYNIPNYGYRVIIASACAAFLLYNSSLILFFNSNRNSTHIIAGIIFFISATLFLIRTLYFIYTPAVKEDYMLSKGIMNDILNLSFFIFSLLLSFGFMLISNDSYKTERKAAEAEVLYDKNILEETTKLARIGSWEIDIKTKSIFMSKITKEILETDADYKTELKTALQFYKDERNRNSISDIIKKAKLTPQSFDINLQITTARGNERWIRVLGKSEFNNDSCTRILGMFQDITKEVKLKEGIKLIEERFKIAFEHSAVGTALVGLDGTFEAVNEQICEITGYSKCEIQQKTYKEITHPDDLNTNLNYLKQLHDGLIKSYSMEKRYFHKNGDIIWVFLTTSAIRDNNNKVLYYIAQIIDINDRKEVEKKLKLSEESYRKIVETAQEGIWMLDKENKSVFVNEKMCEILEYDNSEIIGRKSIDFMSEESSKNAQASLLRRREGIKEKLELNFITKCGKSIWASLSANPVYDENHDYNGSLAMVTDITQNKLATEMIIRSEEKYRSLFNNNPIPIFIWDLETYEISEVNNAATKEYGYSREEFLSMSVLDLRLEEEYNNLIQFAENFINKPDGNLVKTCKHINKSGALMDMNISTFRIIYNERICALAMAENITEKKTAQDLLQKSFEEIRMLTNHLQSIREEERTNIAREIHDELGQQLTVLKMNILSLINKQDLLSPKIKLQSDQMIEMVDKSLETVKKISTQLRPSILDDLGIIAALEWQSMEFQNRTNIICQFNNCCLTDNFTDQINTTVFRIFQESLTNIARHAKASIVTSSLYQQDGYLVLVVQDNGIGICKENKNKKTSFGLLGMKERAAMLNGEINIQNLKAGGTDVTLKIPVSC